MTAFALVLLAGCGAPAGPGNDASDRDAVPHCVGECGRIVDDSAANAWEPFLAIDPKDPDHIVIAHSDEPIVLEPGYSPIGRARTSVSVDGGETWETYVIPSGLDLGPDDALAPYNYAGWQPSLVFLPDGTLVMSAAATTYAWVPVAGTFGGSQTLYTTRSTDGGRSWGDVRIVDEGEGAHVFVAPQGKTTELAELAVGQDGALLLVWVEKFSLHPDDGFSIGGTRIVFSESEDGGLSWTAPRTIVGDGIPYAPSPVVGRDGSWAIAYRDQGDDTLQIATSRDHGSTWQTSLLGDSSLRPILRAQTLSSGVERLLLAYGGLDADGSNFHTEFTWSDDAGATWAPALMIGRPQAYTHPRPNVAEGPGDSAWITFFDFAGDDPEPARYLVAKVVAGIVGEPLLLDEEVSAPSPFMHIRYMGLAAGPSGDALAAWTRLVDGGHDLVWARVTGGDEPVAQVHPQPVVPSGLDEPIEYQFTGHVNFPACEAGPPDPALAQVVRDRVTFTFEVPTGTRFINGTLQLETAGPTSDTSDLDVFLVDPVGVHNYVGPGSTPAPFSLELHVGDEGTWTAMVHNCQSVPTDFTLEIVLS